MQRFPDNIIIQSFHKTIFVKNTVSITIFFHPVIKYLFRGRVCIGRVCMVRDFVAELVMGRVCYGPSLSWAEFVMGRDVPESYCIKYTYLIIYLTYLTYPRHRFRLNSLCRCILVVIYWFWSGDVAPRVKFIGVVFPECVKPRLKTV